MKIKKISDYHFANYCLVQLSNKLNIKFYDLQIEFSDSALPLNAQQSIGLTAGYKLSIGNPDNVSSVVYNIIFGYIKDIGKITRQKQMQNNIDKKNIYVYFANLLRTFAYDDNMDIAILKDKCLKNDLYDYYGVWILLSDLISPLYNINIYNIDIKQKSCKYSDFSQYIKEDGTSKGHIHLNTGVLYQPVRDAYLLKAAIQAFGQNSTQIFIDLTNSKNRQKVENFAKLVYKDNGYMDFMKIIDCFAGYSNRQVSILPKISTAQSNDGHSSFWYMGLIQNMLSAVRGPDWSTYQALEPQHKRVWDNIQKKRAAKGRDGLSYQALIRIQNGQNTPQNLQVIENLLQSHRIW